MTSAPGEGLSSPDPVRDRRTRIATWTGHAKRVGYAAFLTALVVFLIAIAVGFSSRLATVVVVALIVGCVVLAPAIILGYAVKAAERDDRERGF
jgi:phosphotransferase system  glucose/maltose/N-acetylglucosamine-specific IIC component